jgi:hypothetical protein
MAYKFYRSNEFLEVITLLSEMGYGKRSIAEWLDCGIGPVEKALKRLNLSAPRILNTKEYFWSLIDIKNDNECWIWKKRTNNKGYGQFHYNGNLYFSHRLAYILMIGKIPNSTNLCHKCDTPRCCNPNHLFLGSQSDNMIDRTMKGRQPNLTLNPAKVKQIRELYKTHGPSYISKIMGVSLKSVKLVVYNKTWQFVK